MKQPLNYPALSNLRFPNSYFIIALLGIVSLLPASLSAQVKVYTKLYLQGPYSSGLNRHKDVTTSWALILQNNALSQPYNGTPFNYPGTESVSPSVFSATASPADIVDWVLVELKNTGGASVGKRAGFVLENGDVVDIDGSSPLAFNTPPGNYYITVRHRNHLSLSTQQPVALTNAPIIYDFDFTTATDAQLYGSSSSFATVGGTTLLVAGDANSNSIVRYNGPANDRDAILSYLGFNETGYVSNVYRPEDINLDGIVRYNGSANDRDALLSALDFNEVGYKSAAEIPLPVTWGMINATIRKDQFIVNWETLSETNNKEFIIEGSVDGSEWQELGKVPFMEFGQCFMYVG